MLPYLFSQHAYDVWRRKLRHTEIKGFAQSHRQQPSWNGVPEQALSSPRAPCSKCQTPGHPSAVVYTHCREQPSCTELLAGWPYPPPARPTLLYKPGPLQLKAQDTLGMGLGSRGERRMSKKSKTEQKKTQKLNR